MIDTHCHLNDPEAFPAPGATLDFARAAGVDRVIVIGIDATTSEIALAIAEEFDGVFASIGWHPNYAKSFTDAGLARLDELAKHPKCVALGELGLDHHWDFATQEEQDRCLRAQLEWAETCEKPVVLHCREAYPDLLDILESQPSQRWVFHCFSGNDDDARRAVDLGGWFGIDGPITYKKADALRAIVQTLPKERLVLETDSPYMAPHPHRGKPNSPEFLPLIAEGLGSTMGMTLEEVDALTTANAERLFGL